MGRDNLYGFGLVNVINAISKILPDLGSGTTTPPLEISMKVDSLNYSTSGGRNNDRNLNVSVKVSDASDNALGGVTVSVTIRKDLSTWSGSGVTDVNGVVVFSVSNAKSGCYSTNLKSVTLSGYLWDGTNPDEGFCK